MENKKERYILIGVIAVLLIAGGVAAYFLMGGEAPVTGLATAKSSADYYNMFLCSCCNEPISQNCCGMAKERMEYVDRLLARELSEDEILYEMVKKYGESVLADTSRIGEVKAYVKSKAPENPPKIGLETERLSLGTVSQKDGVKTDEVGIRNEGGSDLVIDSMETSCMCTSASIEYEGREGPKFGMSMHGENPTDYRIVIPPGGSAKLKIYYDPNAHGKQETPEERITREITISSNDPEEFQKKIRVDIIQVP